MAMQEKETKTERVKSKGLVALPDTMLAAAIDQFGPPEVVTPHTLPVPRVGRSEIAIALHGAGPGIWDARIRDGTWAPENVSFPLVLGGVAGSGSFVWMVGSDSLILHRN